MHRGRGAMDLDILGLIIYYTVSYINYIPVTEPRA